MDSFAERLRRALELRGIKASTLAYKTDISEAAISHYLAGHYTPKGKRMQVIADALHVSSAWLNGFDVPMNGLEPTPEEDISEDKRLLLELFDRVPDPQKQMVLNMIKAALGKE